MNKIPSDIAVGSDLELFLYTGGFAIQEDNVMVEYNIPPAKTAGQFTKYMKKGRTMVLAELAERYGSKYGLYTRNHTHTFLPSELKTMQATTIGCEPDFNAYNGGKMRLDPPAPGERRSCGGHVHIGGDFHCPDFVAALFAELFIAIRAGHTPTHDDPRIEWYGQPGIYRPKPYGIEYRSPTNKWGMTGGGMNLTGDYALRCARFLTENDAITLQAKFRKVKWVQVREYMLANKRTDKAKKMQHDIVMTAMKAGIPL